MVLLHCCAMDMQTFKIHFKTLFLRLKKSFLCMVTRGDLKNGFVLGRQTLPPDT